MQNSYKPIILPPKKPKKAPKCNCELCSATIGKPKKNTIQSLLPIEEDTDDIPCIKPKRGVHDCGISKSTWYQGPTGTQDVGLTREGATTVVAQTEDIENPCVKKRKKKGRDFGGTAGQSSYREAPDWPPAKYGRLPDIAEEDSTPCPPCRPCRKRKPDIIRRNKVAVKILSKQLSAVKSRAQSSDSHYDSVQLFPTALHAMHWAPAYSLARSQTPPHTCPKKTRPAPQRPPKKPEIDFDDRNRYCACELMANAIKKDLAHHMGLSDQRDKINASKSSIESDT